MEPDDGLAGGHVHGEEVLRGRPPADVGKDSAICGKLPAGGFRGFGMLPAGSGEVSGGSDASPLPGITPYATRKTHVHTEPALFTPAANGIDTSGDHRLPTAPPKKLKRLAFPVPE